eukprot:gene3970-6426_t
MTSSPSSWRLAVNSHAWVPSAKEFVASLARIQIEERERILRFRFVEDAKSSLVGRLLARYAVCKTLRCSNASVELEREESGRPFLAKPETPTQFNFNISHAGAYVVFAGELGTPVGVDVMDLRQPQSKDVSQFFQLMETTFTLKEWQRIKRFPKSQRCLEEFYRYWSLKESYIKAIGVGLHLDLQRLEFTSDDALTSKSPGTVVTDASGLLDGYPMLDWQFHQSYLDTTHCVAVCTRYDQTLNHSPIPFTLISPQEILHSLDMLRVPDIDMEAYEQFSKMQTKPSRS